MHLLLVTQYLLQLSLTLRKRCSSTRLFLVLGGLDDNIRLLWHLSLGVDSSGINEVVLLFDNVHVVFKGVDARYRIQPIICRFLMLGATLRVKTILLIIIFVQKCGT